MTAMRDGVKDIDVAIETVRPPPLLSGDFSHDLHRLELLKPRDSSIEGDIEMLLDTPRIDNRVLI
jgi:hypothetical protein